jgi:gas vesicle protein
MAKINVAFGAVVGAVAGFVTGVLLAPKSGAETRDELKNGAVKAKNTTIDKAEEAKDKASEVASDVAEKAKSVVGDVSSRVKNVAADITEKTEEVKGRVERTIDGAKKGASSKPKTPASKSKATKK